MRRAEVTIDGHRLETALIPGDPAKATIVLLHEGLGSVDLWRAFPSELAARTGHPVLAYSRYGYGRSDRWTEPRTPDYMHHEARVVLPALLAAFALSAPVLVGHSDGASIALLHAAEFPVERLVLIAPHVFVEPLSVQSIARIRTTYTTTDFRAKLGRYHADVDATFYGWNDIWLDERFEMWNIESAADRLAMPLLVVQGEADEYGTDAQIAAIEARAPHARALLVSGAGHHPHRDNPELVVAAIAAFVRGETGSRS